MHLSFGRRFLPIIIGSVLFFFALLGAYLTHRYLTNQEKNRFISETTQVERQIYDRMETYVNALVQTRSMFYVTHEVDRNEFKHYVANLELIQKYPGIQGVGYTEKILKSEIPAFTKRIRREGFPDFKVWPEIDAEERFSIVYLEPMDWRNKRALGYDMFTDDIRKLAMEKARDSGREALSGPVELVQETSKDKQIGFLIYVPVYLSPEFKTTVEDRRSHLKGFIYSPFRSKDFFNQVMGGLRDSALDLEVIYKDEPSLVIFDRYPENKFNSSERLSREIVLNIGQRDWIIKISALPSFRQATTTYAPIIILSLGSLLSFLVFYFLSKTFRQTTLMEKLYQDAQKAIASREEFVNIASHELKTPITSLLIQFQMADKMMKAKNPAVYEHKAMDKRVATALKQLSRMTKLIEDMLDSSRLSLNKLELNKVNFDFNHLIKELLDKYAEQFLAEGIAAATSLPSAPLMIHGDEYRLEQVVSNLINNAIKYGEKNPISISLTSEDGNIVLSIKDSGLGILPENLTKIFNRYERAMSHANISGLGLGLYISKMIALAHGGDILVESMTGKGSTFRLVIPTGYSLNVNRS